MGRDPAEIAYFLLTPFGKGEGVVIGDGTAAAGAGFKGKFKQQRNEKAGNAHKDSIECEGEDEG